MTPTGNAVPDSGVQATETVPWPLRLSGTAYATVAPALVTAATVTGSGHVSSGGSATAGGGVGVGALGELLQPRQQISASSVRNDLGRNGISYGRVNDDRPINRV
ncbi:MAG TPA: hypothetical protein VF491_07445 [Vicinamibacterales bacterium]